MTIIELADEICGLANEHKVDIDIGIDADGNISVSVTPTYRDRPQTDCAWKEPR